MSIEVLLTSLIAAVNANTAALGGKAPAADAAAASTGTDAGASTKTTGTAKGKGKADTKPAGPSREEMCAALTDVKEKFGAADAKAIITKVGAGKMAEIADDKIGTAYTLAKAKLDAAPADDGGDDGDDGL